MNIPVRLRVAALLLLPVLAQANDGIAGVSAGGIVFRKTDAIAMKKEVLAVSHDLITVDYEFLNESAADLEETIVFPLPAYTAALQGSDTYYGQPDGFSIRVDGKAVPFTSVLVALDEAGNDVTATLRKLGLTNAQIANNPAFGAAPKVPPLTAQQKRQLHKLELMTNDGPSGPDEPTWRVQVNYVWKQKFPANQVVRVHHAYHPFVDGGPGAWGIDPDFGRRYCADAGFLKARGRIAARGGMGDAVPAVFVSYILKTGNTWKRGIEDFTLNLVKRKPDELVSLCFPGTFRKVDGNTLQVKLKNFQPAQDLDIYFGNVDVGSGHSGVMPVLPK
jgi:Domain of unknown function (DUF4424)